MNYKRPVNLDKNEMMDCSDFQKKCLEAFAEIAFKYNYEKQFEIFGVGICLVISNLMTTLGITKIDNFLHDLVDNIKRTHETIQKNSFFMEYSNGKKIREGQFN